MGGCKIVFVVGIKLLETKTWTPNDIRCYFGVGRGEKTKHSTCQEMKRVE
jgi:hypothetical protein